MGTPALDTVLVLETPEHVMFRYQLAGPGQRALAYLVDLCIRGLVTVLAVLLVSAGAGAVFSDLWGLQFGILLVIFFVLEWGYYLVFEGLSRGASPGKRLFRLRVIRDDGLPVSLGDSFLRNLLRAADLLPTFYVVGLVAMTLDGRFRRLGDMAARTIVVCEPRSKLMTDATRGVPANLALPARPVLSRKERSALLLFHRRAPELSTARARELAELWAPTLRERFSLPKADALQLLHALHARVFDV